MKFLTILIAVLFYKHWVGDNPVREMVPFDRYRAWFERRTLAGEVRYLLCIGVPALVLWMILIATGDRFAGIVWFAISVVVLLYAIEIHDDTTAFERQGNWLRTIGEDDELARVIEQQNAFRERVAYEHFQGLHPSLFWFLLLGPVGVLVYAFSRDYIAESGSTGDHKASGFAGRVVFWMEWVPVRITGFIYALLGDFGVCFGQWLRFLPDTSAPALVTIDALARSALPNVQEYGKEVNSFIPVAHRELSELRALLDRTVWGWVGVAAIVTVMGW